jgi:O-antigen/teichoic acid export membrane protein
LISRNFIKSSAIYTLAGALPMASAFILMPFYMVFLSKEVFGVLGLYLAVSLLVQILTVYSFDTSIYIHYHDYKNDHKKLSTFVSSAFIFMMLIGVSVGVIFTIAGELIFDLVFADKPVSFYPFGLLAVITGVFQGLFKVYVSLLQSKEEPGAFMMSNLVLFGMIAALTISGLYFYPDSLVGPVGGRVVAGAVMIIWVLVKVYRQFGFHFDYPLLRSTFGFNHYAFIYQVQQWIINYADRFIMLFAALSLASIGIYDFALKCLVVIEVLMNGLHSSFYPKVVGAITAQSDKKSTPELNRYYHGLTAVVMLCIATGILVLPFVVWILDKNDEYSGAIQYFPYIAIIYILRAMRLYFAMPYGVLKYTKPLPVVYSFITLLKIGLMVLLVQQYQIFGLVIAALVSCAVEIIILKYQLRGKFNFQYNSVKMVFAPLILLITVLVLEPVFGEVLTWKLHLLYLAVTLGILAWIYRNELKLLKLKGI